MAELGKKTVPRVITPVIAANRRSVGIENRFHDNTVILTRLDLAGELTLKYYRREIMISGNRKSPT